MNDQTDQYATSRKALTLSGLCQAMAVLMNDLPGGAETVHERQTLEGACAIAEVLIPLSLELCGDIDALERRARMAEAA